MGFWRSAHCVFKQIIFFLYSILFCNVQKAHCDRPHSLHRRRNWEEIKEIKEEMASFSLSLSLYLFCTISLPLLLSSSPRLCLSLVCVCVHTQTLRVSHRSCVYSQKHSFLYFKLWPKYGRSTFPKDAGFAFELSSVHHQFKLASPKLKHPR